MDANCAQSRAPSSVNLFSGIVIDPFDPCPGLIRIADIAHALSMLCRFNGHCRHFYSVAEHSVRVAARCPKGLRLEGLLHDAVEAYLGDVKPLSLSQLIT